MSETWELPAEKSHIPRPFDVQLVPLGVINSCAQYRNKSNPIQKDLNRSVSNRGLINALTATVLDGDTIETYLDFTNGVWQRDISLESFVPYKEPDQFLVLIAGHSRLLAVHADAHRKGFTPMNYFENVRVVDDVATVDEMLQWQSEENIHSTPAPQNLARALAEDYLWLKNRGDPIRPKQFAMRHSVSEQVITDALNYVQLPPELRQLTDADVLPYKVATEMGKAVPVLEKYAYHLGIEGEGVGQLLHDELRILAMCYIRHGRVLRAIQEIKARVENIRQDMSPAKGVEEPLEGFMQIMEEPTPLQRVRNELLGLLRQSRDTHTSDTQLLHNAIAKYCGVAQIRLEVGPRDEAERVGWQLLGGTAVRNLAANY